MQCPSAVPQKLNEFQPTIQDNVVTLSAVVAHPDSRKAESIRVLTNVHLKEREQLLGLGFAIQMIDTASVGGFSGDNLDVDIVVLDRSVLNKSSFDAMAHFSTRGTNAPILFIDGSASLMKQAICGAGVVEGPSGAASMVNALKLAVAFARLNQQAADKEGLSCGKLVLHNWRGFWNGMDLDLTAGQHKIIELLASRPGQYFTYRAIYDRMRHEGFVSGRGPNGYRVNVRSAFRRIRNKFRALDPKFQEIECYRAFGYRWRKPD
jgi:two-component system, OmpR family, response regulator ChvI